MDRLQPTFDRKAIESEAAAWIAQLDGKTPSRDDLAALREWMNRSAMHKQAFERLAELWNDANVLTVLSVPSPGATAPQRSGFFGSLRASSVAVALSVFAAVTLIVLWQGGFLSAALHSTGLVANLASEQPAATYATAIGKQAHVQLADGSRITLNTNSEVRVRYGRERRQVELARGEALFEVAHDRNRPFLVHAGTGLIRAVGTAFTVHLQDDNHVGVIVTEGKVELATVTDAADSATAHTRSPSARSAVLATLHAHQSARFGRAVESIESLPDAEFSKRLAWREGVLRFDGDALSEVVQQVNRYTTQKVIIRDPALRDLRIGGYFKVGETEAMLEALQKGFGVRVERADSNVVYLSRN